MNKRFSVITFGLISLAILLYTIAARENKRQPITITSNASYAVMSLDDLIAQSDLIVIGNLETTYPSRWNTLDGKLPEGTTVHTITSDKIIFTDMGLNVSQFIKGQSNQKSIRIRSLGGVVDQDRMIVDSVVLQTNKIYLLFLKLDKSGSTANIVPGHFWVTGGFQGLYEVADGKAVSFRDQWDIEDLIAYIQNPLSGKKPLPRSTPTAIPTPTIFFQP